MTQTFHLISPLVRANAVQAVSSAEPGMIVTVRKPTRSTRQNALLWALLSDLAKAKPEGRNWTPEVWKAGIMHFLGHQVMFAEGLGGTGPFPMGFRSSHLTVAQMTDLIDCIFAYGSEHGVEFSDARQSGLMELQGRSGE